MAKTPNVTGQGAQWVAQAMSKMPLEKQLGYGGIGYTPPATPTPTGQEHLGTQFSTTKTFTPQTMSMFPGAARTPDPKRGSRMSMHPGGGRTFTPTVKSNPGAIMYGGNVNPNAPAKGSRLSKPAATAKPAGKQPMQFGANTAAQKKTGFAGLAQRVASGFKKNKAGGKPQSIKPVKINPSPHAGNNAAHLRAQTRSA